VGLVLGQQHRPVGELADLLVEVGQDLVTVGVALGDQAGPAPCCDLADASVQGPQADRWAAGGVPDPWDGPGFRLAQQPVDALAKPSAAQPGPA
jgi:hypothetical protein